MSKAEFMLVKPQVLEKVTSGGPSASNPLSGHDSKLLEEKSQRSLTVGWVEEFSAPS